MNTIFLLAFALTQASAVVQPPVGTDTGQLRELTTNGVTLSGYLKGQNPPVGLPITLYNPTGRAVQTKAAANGSFEFTNVARGSYTLRTPGFTTINLVVSEKDLVVDLRPIYSGPGVRVSGHVTNRWQQTQAQAGRTVTLTPQFPGPTVTGGVQALGGAIGSLTGALEAWVRPDGNFEFPSVPSGSYTLRTLPAALGTTTRLEVGANDVRDVEIVLPFHLEVTGRVLLEGRDLGPNAIVQATQPTFTAASGIQTDGSFRLRLTEGVNQISMARLPAEFAVKSISYGSVDVTHSPLKVDTSTEPKEILITLANVSLDSLPGVKVSGRVVTSSQRSGLPNVALRLEPANGVGKTQETKARGDGTFEFSRVTPGNYWLLGMGIPARMRVVVTDTEIGGIQYVAPPQTQVAGSVTVVHADGTTYPFRPDVSVTFKMANGSYTTTGIRADGTFSMPLPDSQYATIIGNIPSDYSIKSISSGSVDLLKNPLVVDEKKVPDNIVVILQYRPGVTPDK